MFQLIVAVVGVALVVILAIIAIWVGGPAFTSSGERALFTTYFNQGTQIEGALKLYNANNGGLPMTVDVADPDDEVESSRAALEKLINEQYLTHAPDINNSVEEGVWIIDGTNIYRALGSDAPEGQCRRLNEFVGKNTSQLDAVNASWDGCPPCGEDAYSDWPGCTRVATP